MNPLELVDVLVVMRGKANDHKPWRFGPLKNHIALAKECSEKHDWFTVSPELYEAVRELGAKLEDCHSALTKFRGACIQRGVKRER